MKEINWNNPKELVEWAEKYVPAIGKADTVGGEIVRACNRVLYRYLNDGDKIGSGYGRETVNAAARYLTEKVGGSKEIDEWVDATYDVFVPSDRYEDIVMNFMEHIVAYLKENPQLFETENNEDMFDWVDDDIDREVPEEEDEDYWEDEDE